MKNKYILYIGFLMLIIACSKSTFLEKKPSSSIIQPITVPELQALLNDQNEVFFMGGLPHISSDDYEVTYDNLQTLSATQRNAHIWADDIYDGDQNIVDWNRPYTGVFYANVVLEGLETNNLLGSIEGNFTKGWALFMRAYCFYDLARNFCNIYDEATSNTDLGLPLRLSADIDYLESRSTLQQTFVQILNDMELAAELLPKDRPTALNRPSKIASYAFLSRVYLDMRKYEEAELYADKALELYDVLIDYNTVSKTSATPFNLYHDELIINANQGLKD